MSDYIIKVENLSKSYQIKHQNAERYTALRDVITHNVKHMGNRLLGRSNGHGPTQETFWALNDVSFEVKPGERVGIIGRNGAGKSTLLKILSRITEPTSGRVRLRGRVASLLEVGTGFHPELTGRENIFLNGAILGMSRDEIKRKFDEIVAFAEVEQFLDTPVKRYSSGMYVRLAFAVAAHLEPEILVVDEVLAVGDAAFQKKCLGKMGEVASEGRTVLFVSHSMSHIETICSRVIYLAKGKLVCQGESRKVIQQYLEESNIPAVPNGEDIVSIPRTLGLTPVITRGYLNNQPLVGTHTVPPHSQLNFTFLLNTEEFLSNCTMGIHFDTTSGARVYAVNTRWNIKQFNLPVGIHEVHCKIKELPIVPGTYYLSIGVSSWRKQVDWLERIAKVQITVQDVYGNGELPWNNQGFFLSQADWDIAPNYKKVNKRGFGYSTELKIGTES